MSSGGRMNWRKERNFDRRMNRFEKSFKNEGRGGNNYPYDANSRTHNFNSSSYGDEYGRQNDYRYQDSPSSYMGSHNMNNSGRQSDYRYQDSSSSYMDNPNMDNPGRQSDYRYQDSSSSYMDNPNMDNPGSSNYSFEEGTSSRLYNPTSDYRDSYDHSDYNPRRNEQYDYGQSSGGPRQKRERPPPELKGREIGLWYKYRSQQQGGIHHGNKTERLKAKMKKQCVPIDLPLHKVQAIREFLDRIGVEAPPTVSQIRMSRGSSSTNVVEKYRHIQDSDFKRKFLRSISGNIKAQTHQSCSYPLLKRNEMLDDLYRNALIDKYQQLDYVRMLDFRKKLPAFDKRNHVIDALDKNQVILISGETGCGKTTQVPQFILDHEIEAYRGSVCRIICTQPRRISAVSVAERVAQERGEEIGDSVGYHIRLEKRIPRETGSITFCTTGILLQIMQSDSILSKISHVILDEIHERDIFSDFSITILRDLIQKRRDLKVILMSASLNAEQFSHYFNNCPTVHIPGFTFPVREFYLEDVLTLTGVVYETPKKKVRTNIKELRKDKKYLQYLSVLEPYMRTMRAQRKYSNDVLEYLTSPDAEKVNLELIVRLLSFICENEPPGAILVFLPGWDKISGLSTKMRESGLFPESKCLVRPLHSMMPTVSQKAIFNRPPSGKRKIVIATNIAETSITIDDIVYVVDCGMIKIKNFDMKKNVSTLREEWVSIANARQRRGRAGRVQAGVCYHLFSRPKEAVLDSYQLPEMLRTRLEEVILHLKVLQLGKAAPFLQKVMDPPPDKIIELSLDLLINMNALDEEEDLTPLGYHLANLPVDPQPGKMILLAALFGCVDPVTSIAASLTFKDPFYIPLGKEKLVDKIKHELAKGYKSDHLLMVEVMDKWRQAEREGWGQSFASKYFLSPPTLYQLRDMKKQFVEHLHEMKFVEERDVESSLLNCNSDNNALLRSIVCAGLYPNVALVRKKKNGRGRKVFTVQDGRVCIHPKSVLCYTSDIEGGFLSYFVKIKTKSLMLHDCTMIFPMSLIFFTHSFTIEDEGNRKIIILNNQIHFSCDPNVAELIQELRAWLDWLLEFKIAHPGTIDWDSSSDETLILKAIVVLLTAESRMYLPESSDQSDAEMNEDDDDMDDQY